MKKFLVLSLAVLLCLGGTGVVFAQPLPPNLAADSYDASPGDGIPTPNTTVVAANIYSSINLLLGTPFVTNQDVDSYQLPGQDYFWHDLSTDQNKGNWIFIGISADNRNLLNVYKTSDVGTLIPVLGPYTNYGFSGDGTSAHPFAAEESPFSSNEDFGWVLNSHDGTNLYWDSDPNQALRDNGGWDHMLTYDLKDLAGKTVWIKTGCTQVNVNNIYTEVCADTKQYTFNRPYLIGWEDLPFHNNRLGDEDYNDTIFLVDRVSPVPEPMSIALFGSGLLGLAGLRRKKA